MFVKRIIVPSLLILSLVISTISLPQNAAAVSGADWDAGNIIDDTIFTDASRLTVAEIQAFLNARVPNCDTYGTAQSELGGGTRAQYGASKGNPAPFTCLKDYYEVPKLTPGPETPASNYGGVPIPAGAKSAAQIIWDAAQQYQISPAVLLVKLATESAGPLTSDVWPFKKQYNYAMGARCPDSGPNGSANCDTNYSGFSLQIYESAALMRWYLNSMDQPWWSYKKPYQVNNILWNVVERGCGGSNVYIQNKATAALYTYTPYQPNQAALANLYGTGDNCSAYGNRNFWRVYSDWFGSTKGSIIRTYEDGKMYVRGAGNTYYYITSGDQLQSLGYGSTIKSYYNTSKNVFNNMTFAGDLPNVVRFNGGEFIYLIDSGQKKYFDYATWLAFGQPPVGDLSVELNNLIPSGANLTNVVQSKGSFDLYAMDAGKKRHLSSASYQTGGYNSKPTTVISEGLFNSIAKGAPLLPAGVLIKASDTGVSYTTTQNGVARKAIEANTAKSIVQSAYQDTETVLGQLTTEQSSPITLLVKNNIGDLFITDTSKKVHLNAGQLAALGKTANDFVLVETSYLNRFPTISTSGDLLIRIQEGERVYKVEAGKIVDIQTGDDFNRLGYNFSNVIVLSNNTVANILTNAYRSIVLPGTLFRTDGSPTVYLMGDDNESHVISSGYIFNSFNFNSGSVRVVTPATLTAYPVNTPLSYVIKTPDDAWWLISNGLRHWIPTEMRTAYTSSTYPPVEVPVSTLARINPAQNTTRFIRIDTSPVIYYIDGGQKRALSQYMFSSLGGTLNQVLSVSPYTAGNFITGPTMY